MYIYEEGILRRASWLHAISVVSWWHIMCWVALGREAKQNGKAGNPN